MPKIVPSQVVDYIEKMFPIVADENRYTKVELTPARFSALKAVIEFTDSIPDELINVEIPASWHGVPTAPQS